MFFAFANVAAGRAIIAFLEGAFEFKLNCLSICFCE